LATGVALAAKTNIDHFDTTQTISIVMPVPLPTTVVDSIADALVLGGERDVIATMTSGVNATDRLKVDVNPGGNSYFTYSSDVTINGTAEIQWDGSADATKSNLDYTGLGGIDLTEAGARDRILLGVTQDDVPVNITIYVYTDASNWSYAVFGLTGGIQAYAPRTFTATFANFVVGGGTGVDFTNVGAMTLFVDASVPVSTGLDLSLHLIGITDDKTHDFGDLPDTYGITNLADDGPRHLEDGIVLGSAVTTEVDGQEDPAANGDGSDDGVVPPPGAWVAGINGGKVNVTTNCPTTCYLSAWIDWNRNSVYAVSERIMLDRPVSGGTQLMTFNIPAGTTIANRTFNARFRLYPISTLGQATPTGEAINGEVEDYQWGFQPTSVSLTTLQADSNPATPFYLTLAGALSLLGLGGLALWLRRKARPAPAKS
jgi:hypothetical protein